MKCQRAMETYNGNCTEALMLLIKNDAESFQEKNNAVWALGQLGDVSTLAFLENYYTGYDEAKKEKLNEGLSQYELYKSINLLKGGYNITASFWR